MTAPGWSCAAPTEPAPRSGASTDPSAICGDRTERAGVAVSERTAALLRSVLASEPFLTWRVVMVFLRMEPPSMRRLAWAGPPSATNRAMRATTIAGEGRRRVMRM